MGREASALLKYSLAESQAHRCMHCPNALHPQGSILQAVSCWEKKAIPTSTAMQHSVLSRAEPVIHQQPLARMRPSVFGGIVVGQQQGLGAGVEARTIGSLYTGEWL